MIDGNKLVGGNITETSETKTDENGVSYTEKTYTGSGTILDGNSGNITITGSLTSYNGNVELNGIQLAGEQNNKPGTISFKTDDGTATINLKEATLEGNNTPGAMLMQATKGIAIETDGTLYLCSRVKDSEGK
jgi:hypothetical protein